MTYNIRKSDGTLFIELANGFIDNTAASLTFIGKNVTQFGEIQNNNFLHLLENFSSSFEPLNKITGQLWFDKGTSSLKVYNGAIWQNLSSIEYSQDSAKEGDFWFNTSTNQLFINTGNGFSLIGPDGAPDRPDPTRMITRVLTDLDNVDHPVITAVLNSSTIAVFSDTTFDVNSTNAVSGFPKIYKGITLKNGYSHNDAQVYGWSEYSKNSDKLKNENGNYVSATTSTLANSIVQRDGEAGISVNRITLNAVNAVSTGLLEGTWQVTNNFTPYTNGDISLGSTTKKWNTIYSQTQDTNTVNAVSVKFSNLTDGNLASITRFDNDSSLAANSDSRLATQRAIKKYIDDTVAAEVQSRLSGDQALQTQINNFQTLPAGTIMYTPTSAVPNGFLPLNGQAISKNTYSALYALIGGYYGETLTTFNLPDLRGEFIRGWDNGRGIDPGRTVGSSQTDMFKAHTHRLLDNNNATFVGDRPNAFDSAASINQTSSSYVDTQSTGGTETRPRNIALQAIIKY
jgi:microcystin-dependent protein